MNEQVLEHGAMLLSDGENHEYDRAIAELCASIYHVKSDDVEYTLTILRELKDETWNIKEADRLMTNLALTGSREKPYKNGKETTAYAR